jgi:drug/metabolite transporter (DMT)-like permease
MLTALFVLARVVANPVSNVFQKRLSERGANPVFIIAAAHAILTLAVTPILAVARLDELDLGFWTNIGLCALLAVASNVTLVYALRRSDLSVLGPVNAYKAVLGLGLGVVLLGEIPTVFGAAGVLLVLVGSYFVVDREPGQAYGSSVVRFLRDPGIQLRFAALALSATEAVFLKRAILRSSPLTTFIFWSVLGLPVASAGVMLLHKCVGQEVRRLGEQWRFYVWLALTTGLMQAATLLTFDKLPVGYSLALFQLSTLISVFLGHRYFAERNIGRRLIGAVIMVLGAVLIVSLGRPA